MRLYFARHNGVNLSAATMLIVGGHVWYSYGASDNIGREVRPSNAMQWRMLRDAYALGATVYDLRGISDSLDETDHLFGLIQFKVGTGGEAAEYLGEWDFPLNKLLHKALGREPQPREGHPQGAHPHCAQVGLRQEATAHRYSLSQSQRRVGLLGSCCADRPGVQRSVSRRTRPRIGSV